MSVLVVRHGLSEANNRLNYGSPAFGSHEASLMPDGRLQAIKLGERLVAEYGIDLDTEPVAVSMMRRTQETAIAAGLRHLHLYPELNEEKGGMNNLGIATALELRRPPRGAILAAKQILENPPEEKVWITHGLLIATICQELGIYQDERFTPKFCEIRELPI